MGEINTPITTEKDIFEDKKPTACTSVEGVCGHSWPAKLALVDCAGCSTKVLLSKMENCPYCNEPAKAMTLRVDCIARGQGAHQRCKGEKSHCETLDVVIERTTNNIAQVEHKMFLDKEGK